MASAATETEHTGKWTRGPEGTLLHGETAQGTPTGGSQREGTVVQGTPTGRSQGEGTVVQGTPTGGSQGLECGGI